MSHLVAASRPIAGAHVVKRYPGHGILGADVPTTGDGGGSPVLNDGIDPAKCYAWRVVTPPTGGTLTIYPDLSFDLVQGAAPDGSYPWTYRLLEDGQDVGTAVVSSTFGTTAVSLTATSISTQPVTLGSPGLAQTHVLSATAISTRPILGAPALTEIAPSTITAQAISTQPITLGSPAIAQTHSLSAVSISTRPTLGTPVLTQVAPGAIAALGITTAPVVLGAPALAQKHALSAGAIAAGPPTFTTPTLSQQHALVAQWIVAGSPVLGTPALTEGSAAIEVWPLVSDVRLGVSYGPTGSEYIGTLVPGSGTSATASEIADAVVAALGGSTGGWPSSTQIADAVWAKALP